MAHSMPSVNGASVITVIFSCLADSRIFQNNSLLPLNLFKVIANGPVIFYWNNPGNTLHVSPFCSYKDEQIASVLKREGYP